MTADDRRPESPHPDLDTLADLYADALSAPAAEQVRAHVAGCPHCTATLRALDQVHTDLHSLPAPAVPPEVTARLDATLASLRAHAPARRGAAAASRSADAAAGEPAVAADADGAAARQPAVAADADGAAAREPADLDAGGAAVAGGAVPGGGAEPAELAARRAEREFDELERARLRRSRRLVRGLTGVAAAVVVIAAGASITAIVRAGDSPTNATSAAGGSADSAAAPSSAGIAPNARSDSAASPEVQQTVPSYDRAGLSAALPQIAREHPVAGAAAPAGAGAMADLGRRTACAGTIRDAAGSLRAVAQITYQNRPAYVFVYDDDGSLTGYVVSDQCGTPAALPATVIDTVR